eukprot:gene13666-biopygen113
MAQRWRSDGAAMAQRWGSDGVAMGDTEAAMVQQWCSDGVAIFLLNDTKVAILKYLWSSDGAAMLKGSDTQVAILNERVAIGRRARAAARGAPPASPLPRRVGRPRCRSLFACRTMHSRAADVCMSPECSTRESGRLCPCIRSSSLRLLQAALQDRGFTYGERAILTLEHPAQFPMRTSVHLPFQISGCARRRGSSQAAAKAEARHNIPASTSMRYPQSYLLSRLLPRSGSR